MDLLKLVCFILIDLTMVLCTYKVLGKMGIVMMYIIHIIISQLAIKLQIQVLGLDIAIGSMAYAVLFLTMDMMNELYGKKNAMKLVDIGLATLITFLIIIYFIKYISINNDNGYINSFNTLLSNQWRIIASDIIISYCIFQKINVLIFDVIRKITGERLLWLRNNISTIICQIATAFLFYEFAFAGLLEQKIIIQIIIGGLIVKLFVTILETPFLYISKKIKPREELL